ncbi:4Fe-4S double cluster binding domain-containing protein [Desulfoluna spongiiphila]|uniref:Epoxyqueuosine reductase n=1 Tax=Desulfoluna spongiiphila TaxID=419481 RepID=A0A1G5ASB4_9BACT|nr:4Fe-4S double cluster binding domain-containing protein [Desulfoluna spongiiphila]SCX80776.1 epoxyqueuosine reductase [Desulfoluna spongiiphila]
MKTHQFITTRALLHNEKAKVIPVRRLHCLQDEIHRFQDAEDLNDFQQWIVDELYTFDVPDVGFPVESILLIAVPHPFCAHVEFSHRGRTYKSFSFVMPDFKRTEEALRKALSGLNHHLAEAGDIPLKRLAVQSGLAAYGRNNICYIDGMGSNFSLMAYFTDMPCEEDPWTDVTMSSSCTDCNACLNNCPTRAIRKERFLIDNEKCLSFLNESGAPFPEWLPETVHHCVYDCMKCQIVCPMNRKQVDYVTGPVQFTESETDHLLSGTPFEDFPMALQNKATYLGLHQWPEGIPRNLKTLFDISDRKGDPTETPSPR